MQGRRLLPDLRHDPLQEVVLQLDAVLRRRAREEPVDERDFRRVAGIVVRDEPQRARVLLVPRHAEEREAVSRRASGERRAREEPGARAHAVARGRLADPVHDDAGAALTHVVLRRDEGQRRRREAYRQLHLAHRRRRPPQPRARSLGHDAHGRLAVLQAAHRAAADRDVERAGEPALACGRPRRQGDVVRLRDERRAALLLDLDADAPEAAPAADRHLDVHDAVGAERFRARLQLHPRGLADPQRDEEEGGDGEREDDEDGDLEEALHFTPGRGRERRQGTSILQRGGARSRRARALVR